MRLSKVRASKTVHQTGFSDAGLAQYYHIASQSRILHLINLTVHLINHVKNLNLTYEVIGLQRLSFFNFLERC